MMKVKWNGQSEFLVLTHGKIYEVLSVEKGWYRIKDDSGEDYLYPPEGFEIVQWRGGRTMIKPEEIRERSKKSAETLKILEAGGEIDCPLCKKGKIKMRTPATFLCDHCGKGIIIDYKIV